MIRLFNIMLLCFSTTFLFSGTDGTIRGQVLDVNGEAIPGVAILIEELSQGFLSHTISIPSEGDFLYWEKVV